MSNQSSKIEELLRGPALGLSAASFAATLQLISISPRPDLAIEAVEHFAIGIPMLAALGLFPLVQPRGIKSMDASILTAEFILFLFSGYHCVNGLVKCFGLVSHRAALLFGSVFAWWLISFTFQLVLVYLADRAAADAEK